MTKAKAEFSNSNNANLQKWNAYIKKADPKRQEVLAIALDWVAASDGVTVDAYLAQHRNDDNITELKTYFTTVIDWVGAVFKRSPDKEMKGLEWDRLYETYHSQSYDPAKVDEQVTQLLSDPFVDSRRGVYEYVLGGGNDPKLLSIRVFDDKTIALRYQQQTDKAKKAGTSNCPLCALSDNPNKNRICRRDEMDADHVTAWSKGGATDLANCEMLCITHNRAKGNR